jgi:isochorismate pyruvate lyase
MTAMTLEEIRREIDGIDSQIIGLLSKRGRFVAAAGKLKKDEQGVRDPKRVEQVIEKVRAKAEQAGFDQDIAEEVYRAIIGCFIRRELLEFSEKTGETGGRADEVVIKKPADED